MRNAGVGDTGTSPQPACPAGGRGTQEWRKTEYTERLAAFYDLCTYSECFPRGVGSTPPDRVVLSCSHAGSLHRVAGDPAADETSAVAADGGSAPDPFADCECVPVTVLTDLQRGDGIVWDAVTEPWIVHSQSADSVGVVQLKGPNGGDYFLEVRPDGMGTVVYPGHGHVSELRRIVAPEPSVGSLMFHEYVEQQSLTSSCRER